MNTTSPPSCFRDYTQERSPLPDYVARPTLSFLGHVAAWTATVCVCGAALLLGVLVAVGMVCAVGPALAAGLVLCCVAKGLRWDR